MPISDGWFPRPVTMTLIDGCGQTESGMGGLWYREMLSEIIEFQFSGPTAGCSVRAAPRAGRAAAVGRAGAAG